MVGLNYKSLFAVYKIIQRYSGSQNSNLVPIDNSQIPSKRTLYGFY
jgi:hypothetical protein